jgi:hypothetical protein
MDINRATEVNQEVTDAVRDMFEYHAWDEDKIGRGALVRNVLMDAVRMIIATVPPCPDRTVAIRKIREARMDCNSAITHGGKY